jgi:ribosomal protein S18 acetylase RimI-like enzyme
VVHVSSYRPEHFGGVRELWEEVFPEDPPWNRAEVAIPAKLAVQGELFLVAEQDGSVVGTVMAGFDGHRGWLYSVGTKLSMQRNGVGSMLVMEAERRLHALGCTKINLQIRAGNEAVAEFYRHLGYAIEDRISMGKRTG